MSERIATPPIRVRVVIPCRDEAGYIGRCLESLIACDRSGASLEVWVCDGMSEDGTRAEVEGFAGMHPWIRLVDNPARTTPQAMNVGLRPTGYDVGIILGAHAEVDPVFVRANLDALADHPEAGCVGGVIESVFQDATSRRIGAAMGHPFGVGGAYFRTGRKEGYVDTVAFGAYRRKVFERVGYFDERLARNQDDEFNYRVTKAGFRIWLSSGIRSRYVVRGTYARLWRQYRQYGYWKVYVNRLHRTITTLRQLMPAALVAFLVSGAAFSWVHSTVAWAWCMGVILYALATGISAVQSGQRMSDMPGVALAFVVLHLSYGTGYLQGIVDFILLRKDPAARAADLTR